MEAPDYVPATSEIGSLTAHSNEDSQFVGSSSGVYFVHTVKRAFSTGIGGSGSPDTEFPTAEDTLVGPEDSPRQKRRRTTSSQDDSSPSTGELPSQWMYNPAIAASLGNAPPLDLGKELMMMFFKVWHPLFPFLHGPSFLQAMERLYHGIAQEPSAMSEGADYRSICWTVILQCTFNLGCILRPDLQLPPESRIKSPGSLVSLLSKLASRHDIASLQALLAAEVYLVATMSLRLASTFGGCVLRSILHAGLHRCPFRYAQLSSHDRQLRKRIFWCAYAIDRYLSQALGLPLGIQDSDIDVCLPAAAEMHSPRQTRPLHGASTGNGLERSDSEHNPALGNEPEGGFQHDPPQTSDGLRRHDVDKHKGIVLASYVDSGTLTGRALELFHKSILVRSARRSSVLFLVTDVHKWWHSLPLHLQGKATGLEKVPGGSQSEYPFDFGPFFTVLYQHLILIIHRPLLSLPPSSAEFCSGLQTCIGAAREILAALKAQIDSQQALFWPGFLSAAWMSGLVLAFACQLKQYALVKGLQEIDACSRVLHRMSTQWETARHCQNALAFLSDKIKQMHSVASEAPEAHSYALRTPDMEISPADPSFAPWQKRRRRSSYIDGYPHDSAEASLDYPGEAERRFGIDATLLRASPTVMPNEDVPPNDYPSVEFQNVAPSHLAGGSSSDLNMVDLLQDANFDSLLDLIGQQYPGF
ncbi:uncharacterized protein N7459_002647 [Penicillium hispanicum]|uniref:uncharacterized protein n=1 Tax=Penicillium hispanicum TaxID=1080232 RepID=UPI00254033A4|nr:uncharacterized protein N7459_002647 [Penicillium hispanicum]KAJ5586882.1 hypothetical protein N7459_002647 [Penicillium hispanicum]